MTRRTDRRPDRRPDRRLDRRLAVLGGAMMVAAETGGAFGQSGIDALFFAGAPADRLPWAVAGSGALLLGLSLGLAALAGWVASVRLFVALPVLAAVDALLRERQEVATALLGSLSRRLAAPRPAAR